MNFYSMEPICLKKYFEFSTKDFTINNRVENLGALTEQLKNEGVKIVDKIEAANYGNLFILLTLKATRLNFGSLKMLSR